MPFAGMTASARGWARCAEQTSRRLEQLDRVARRVFAQDLLTAGSGDDVVAEADALVLQLDDERAEVVHREDESIPAARLGLAAVRHGPRGRRPRAGQPERQIVARHDRHIRPELLPEREAEVLRIECDRSEEHTSELQ